MNDLRLKDVVGLVEEIYRQLTLKLEGQNCKACGKCCDFESFGHRLYITSPELIYFRSKLKENDVPLLETAGSVCPYRVEGKCSVYPWRFAGCRIFQCCGDKQAQGRLSEWAVEQMKAICRRFDAEYYYRDLLSALNGL